VHQIKQFTPISAKRERKKKKTNKTISGGETIEVNKINNLKQ
jgi:hypothetical protein